MTALVHNFIFHFILSFSIQAHEPFLEIDNLKNIYVKTVDNSLIKYDSTGHLLFSFNEKKFGRLQSVDAANPQKILLYYPDFATVLILDNTLSRLTEFDLKKMGLSQVSAACLSYDNNFWIFDSHEFKLKKIDASVNDILISSNDMFTAVGESVTPLLMRERENKVYVNDSAIGILVFDIYGTYIETIPVKHLQTFDIENDMLFYLKNNQLINYDLKSLTENLIELPDTTHVRQAILENGLLYLLHENELNLYSYK